jgi:hypothetical protein
MEIISVESELHTITGYKLYVLSMPISGMEMSKIGNLSNFRKRCTKVSKPNGVQCVIGNII